LIVRPKRRAPQKQKRNTAEKGREFTQGKVIIGQGGRRLGKKIRGKKCGSKSFHNFLKILGCASGSEGTKGSTLTVERGASPRGRHNETRQAMICVKKEGVSFGWEGGRQKSSLTWKNWASVGTKISRQKRSWRHKNINRMKGEKNGSEALKEVKN